MVALNRTKTNLLRIFLTNPDRSFYMQELGRILGKKPGVFQRALNALTDEGILKSEYRANARYFWANKDYLLYKELKGIIFKTSGIEGSIQKSLKKVKGICFSFIYGSVAKGRDNASSDIDLCIVGDINEKFLIKELDLLERQLQREINYILYSEKNFEKQLKANDPFLKEILTDKKIMLIGTEGELQQILKK